MKEKNLRFILRKKMVKKIVFMGTPQFAAYNLEKIITSGIEVAAVVTTPDKRKGRGLKVTESDVKRIARKYKLPILQPEDLKDENFVNELRAFDADLFVVVAFKILPKNVWQLPKLGTINLHASLLPQYRGAAPINWVIINGEKETGVTTFFINEKVDAGEILKQKRIKIYENDTVGDLHDRLMKLGAEVLVETINDIFYGRIKSISQKKIMISLDKLKKAPKIFKDTCKINWNLPASKVYNFIRGLSPFPGAWFKMELEKSGEKKIVEIKVLRAFKTNIKVNKNNPGIIFFIENKFLIAANDFFIELAEIKLQSKPVMSAVDFINGYSKYNLKIVD